MSLASWWRLRRRRRECHAKYGDACPHLERHAEKWTTPRGYSVINGRREDGPAGAAPGAAGR